MNTLTRRRFLTYSTMATAAAAATTAGWMELADRARTDPLPPGAPVLVLVTLYGGNDGLNTVVPAADPAYHAARPDLAYDEGEVLDLGEGLGLNPGLTGLKQQWDRGTLAIVRGVSYPKPDRSHFRSMDIWQTADPVQPTSTGWIGRWLDANGHDPLTAISLEPVLPPLLAGETTTGAALPLRGLALPRGPLGAAFAAMGSGAPGESAPQATAARSIADLHRTVDTFGPAVDDGGGSGGGALAAQLDVVARCIELGAPSPWGRSNRAVLLSWMRAGQGTPQGDTRAATPRRVGQQARIWPAMHRSGDHAGRSGGWGLELACPYARGERRPLRGGEEQHWPVRVHRVADGPAVAGERCHLHTVSIGAAERCARIRCASGMPPPARRAPSAHAPLIRRCAAPSTGSACRYGVRERVPCFRGARPPTRAARRPHPRPGSRRSTVRFDIAPLGWLRYRDTVVALTAVRWGGEVIVRVPDLATMGRPDRPPVTNS